MVLPCIEWIWTPAAKRKQVWVWPQEHPAEMDVDVSDLTPSAEIAEGSDPHAVEFTPLAMPNISAASKLDEVILAALTASETGQPRGSKRK